MKRAIIILVFILFNCSGFDNTQKLNKNMTFINEGEKLNYVLYKDKFLLFPNILLIHNDNKVIVFTQTINEKFIRDYFNPNEYEPPSSNMIDSIINSNKNYANQLKYSESFWLFHKYTDSLDGPYLMKDYKTILELHNISLNK
jgi:hypothetical protein